MKRPYEEIGSKVVHHPFITQPSNKHTHPKLRQVPKQVWTCEAHYGPRYGKLPESFLEIRENDQKNENYKKEI